MAKLVEKNELSRSAVVISINDCPFTESDVKELTANLKQYSLSFDDRHDSYYMHGE